MLKQLKNVQSLSEHLKNEQKTAQHSKVKKKTIEQKKVATFCASKVVLTSLLVIVYVILLKSKKSPTLQPGKNDVCLN